MHRASLHVKYVFGLPGETTFLSAFMHTTHGNRDPTAGINAVQDEITENKNLHAIAHWAPGAGVGAMARYARIQTTS